MTVESTLALRASKIANIIQSLGELHDIPLNIAADMFYQSDAADMIEDGVADLQCRSDKYLATLVWEESREEKTRGDSNAL